MENKKSSAGKGDDPRNCFSKEFRDNYDAIDWGHPKEKTPKDIKSTSDSKKSVYPTRK